MPLYGWVVVIKRNGADGSTFPLLSEECYLGRDENCDIRIQLPVVSKKHARISVQTSTEKVFLQAISHVNFTKLNGKSIPTDVKTELMHKDVFTIGDRHFRWEFREDSPYLTVRASATPAFLPRDPNTEKILTPKEKVPMLMDVSSAVKRLREEDGGDSEASRKKRVSFGPYVSPEYFDKALPPATPVRKGAVPPSETPKGGGPESPRPDSVKRTIAIRKSLQKVSAAPKQGSIAEESPRGVLRKGENDFSLIKENSGYRSSPRSSPTRADRSSGVETLCRAPKNNSHRG